MNTLSRALAIAALAVSVPATIVMAQQAEDTPPEQTQKTEQTKKMRGPSPETMARLEDGRIAGAKAALKLTPEQEALWAPVEEQIRAEYAERRKMHEERRAKHEARREAKKDGARTKPTLPERVERQSERMANRATRMSARAAWTKEFAAVLTPFYNSLSDEQKDVANHVLRRFAGGKKGHGRHGGKRMCDRRGGGGHHGKRWH